VHLGLHRGPHREGRLHDGPGAVLRPGVANQCGRPATRVLDLVERVRGFLVIRALPPGDRRRCRRAPPALVRLWWQRWTCPRRPSRPRLPRQAGYRFLATSGAEHAHGVTRQCHPRSSLLRPDVAGPAGSTLRRAGSRRLDSSAYVGLASADEMSRCGTDTPVGSVARSRLSAKPLVVVGADGRVMAWPGGCLAQILSDGRPSWMRSRPRGPALRLGLGGL
jgi:hypothetical protein